MEGTMSQMFVEKPTEETLKDLGVNTWPIWQKEVSEYDWSYDQKETCYILEGKAEVKASDGQTISFGVGDLVVFNPGLTCVWKITEDIKKHYKFE